MIIKHFKNFLIIIIKENLMGSEEEEEILLKNFGRFQKVVKRRKGGSNPERITVIRKRPRIHSY